MSDEEDEWTHADDGNKKKSKKPAKLSKHAFLRGRRLQHASPVKLMEDVAERLYNAHSLVKYKLAGTIETLDVSQSVHSALAAAW